jgi:DNA-binding response OmpR family regulator
MVVDDDPDIRTIVTVNLEGAGHRVLAAASAAEALALLAEEVPDVVFLDLMMPDVDGWAVLQELKSPRNRRLSEVPVFLLAALVDDAHRWRGGIEGALDHITKPFDPSDLLRAVDAVCGPGAPPEPELRRRVRAASLRELARHERGAGPPGTGPGSGTTGTVGVHLTRLEPQVPATQPAPSPRLREARARLGSLTPKQRRILEHLAAGRSVTAVAAELGMSRSNVYAGLRRIGRRLGLYGTDELLGLLRSGELLAPDLPGGAS